MIDRLLKARHLPFVLGAFDASVSTDQQDYSPGDIVQISGSGFQPGESVQLQVTYVTTSAAKSSAQVTSSYDASGHDPWFVFADGSGNFSSSWLVENDSLGQTLLLTADGVSSHAQTTFTDSAGDDFKQCANETPDGDGRCKWIGSILQNNNSKYFEGMSTMQRLIFVDVSATTGNNHVLGFGHDATKGGIHAYDFLTSWEQAIQAGEDSGFPYVDLEAYTPVAGELGTIDQTLTDARACGASIPNNTAPICLALRGPTGFRFDVLVPDDAFVSKDGSTQQRINGYEAAYGQRYLRIYSNAVISAASFDPIVHSVADGGDTGDSSMAYQLRWTSTATQVMFEFGAHISAGGAQPNATSTGFFWGTGLGSSSISGGPYHVNLDFIDGDTSGAQDNQLQGSDILVPKGTITIIKDAVPDSAQDFAYTTTGTGLSPFSLDDDGDPTLSNTKQFADLNNGTYTVTETLPVAGWALTSLVCDDPNGGTTTDPATGLATINLSAGEAVTCTYTNTKNGRIEIEKQTLPDGSAATFGFTGDITATLSDGQNSGADVAPGNYSVVESAKTGWALTSVVCNDSDSTGSTGTRTASFVVAAGETVRCVFTNTQDGRIEVEKQTLPDGSSATFGFTGDITATLSDGQNSGANVAPGNYSVVESAKTGWALTSVVCNDSNSTGSTGTRTASYIVAPGETVRCVFTNTQDGRIEVEKQTLPDGSSATFGFTGDITATLSDGQNSGANVAPGNYSVVESAKAHWDLTSIVCNDSNSTGSTGTRTASYIVAPGETVRCVFTNTQRGSITITKDAVPDSALDFNFTSTSDQTTTIGSFALDDDADGTLPNSRAFSDLLPGAYTVIEAGLPIAGWDLTNLVCVGGGANTSSNTATGVSTIGLDAGENVTCTYTNTKQTKLKLVKTVTNNNGGTAVANDWDLSATGSGGFTELTPDAANATFRIVTPDVTYALGETGPSGYAAGSFSCNGGTQVGDSIQLSVGQVVTCTINNDDIPPQLHLRKIVVNDNGGTAVDTDWTLTANGTGANDLSGSTPVDSGVGLQADTWALSETGPAGYSTTGYVCVGGTQVGQSISVGIGGSATCTITNDDIPGTIIIQKITKPVNDPTSFNFDSTGTDYVDFSLTGQAGSNTNSQTLNAGNYSVQEITIPDGWTLTGIGDPANGNNCVLTVTGSGTSTGTGDLNTQTATIHLGIGDTIRCTFENTGTLVTRTQGFWATHTLLADAAWFGGEAGGHKFSGVAAVTGIGDTLLCGRPIDTLEELMGGFWANIAKKCGGGKRTQLDQARMRLLQQLLAAELNAAAFGSVPSGGIGKFAQWEDAFCNGNIGQVNNAQSQAAAFNTAGDSGVFTPGTSADAKNARTIADTCFWDSPAGALVLNGRSGLKNVLEIDQ